MYNTFTREKKGTKPCNDEWFLNASLLWYRTCSSSVGIPIEIKWQWFYLKSQWKKLFNWFDDVNRMSTVNSDLFFSWSKSFLYLDDEE